MKSFFTKIVSFFLAATIFFSTVSFAVDMHFCCNKLVDMTFFGKAESCSDIALKEDNNSRQCTSIQEKDCCSNKTIVKTADESIKKAQTHNEFENIVFLNTFFYTYLNLFEGLETNVIPFEQYRPPLLYRDILLLHETFLI